MTGKVSQRDSPPPEVVHVGLACFDRATSANGWWEGERGVAGPGVVDVDASRVKDAMDVNDAAGMEQTPCASCDFLASSREMVLRLPDAALKLHDVADGHSQQHGKMPTEK